MFLPISLFLSPPFSPLLALFLSPPLSPSHPLSFSKISKKYSVPRLWVHPCSRHMWSPVWVRTKAIYWCFSLIVVSLSPFFCLSKKSKLKCPWVKIRKSLTYPQVRIKKRKSLCETAKAMTRGNFMALNAFIKNAKKSQVNNLSSSLKNEQNNSKVRKRNMKNINQWDWKQKNNKEIKQRADSLKKLITLTNL